MTTANSEPLTEAFRNMQLSTDDIVSAEILKKWLDNKDSKLGSRVAADEGSFRTGNTIQIVYPMSGITIKVECGSKNMLNLALATAKTAKQKWANLESEKKSGLLYQLAQTFEKHAGLFATAEAVCYTWKRFEKCGASAQFASEYLYSAAATTDFYEESVESMLVVQDALNSPINLVAEWRVGESLVNGCPVVLVVPATCCLPALLFSDICTEANLPEGLFSVVIMDPAEAREIRSPSRKDFYLLPLLQNSPHLATCLIVAGADVHSAVDGVLEMLADCWGTPGYLGVVLYIQDCLEAETTRILRERVKHVRTGLNNFASTIDIVSDTPVRLVRSTQVSQVGEEPTIYFQGFKTTKEASGLVCTGPWRSDSLSIWTEQIGVAFEISDRLSGYRNIWLNGQHLFEPDLKRWEWPFRGGGNSSEAIGAPSEAFEEPQCNLALDRVDQLLYGGARNQPTGSNEYRLLPETQTASADGDPAALRRATDVGIAVEAAAKASAEWSKLSPLRRSKHLLKFANALNECEGIRGTMTETTRRTPGSRYVNRCAEAILRWTGSCGISSTTASKSRAGVKVFSTHQPLSVIAILFPSTRNVESLLYLIAGAISNGNTVVVSVAEESPSCPLSLLIKLSGLPTGVINILPGPTEQLLAPLAGHSGLSSLWCWAEWETASVVEGRDPSKERSIWWFESPEKWPDSWPEERVRCRRCHKKDVWLPVAN